MTHRTIKPDLGLGPGESFPNENAQKGKIRAENARLGIRWRRRDRDSTDENLESIAKHTREAKGQSANGDLDGLNKHWDLSTLRYLVDDEDNITHMICGRD